MESAETAVREEIAESTETDLAERTAEMMGNAERNADAEELETNDPLSQNPPPTLQELIHSNLNYAKRVW